MKATDELLGELATLRHELTLARRRERHAKRQLADAREELVRAAAFARSQQAEIYRWSDRARTNDAADLELQRLREHCRAVERALGGRLLAEEGGG